MNKSKNIKRIIKYIKKHLLILFLSIICALLFVIATLYIPILIGDTIDIITINNVNFDLAKSLLLKVFILVSIASIAQFWMNILNNKMTYAITKDIRNEAFSKIQTLPLKYIDSHPYGEIVSKIIVDVDTFADGIFIGFSQLFTGIVTIIGTLVFMFSINWLIGSLIVIITPISLIVARFIANRTYVMFKKQSEIRGEETGFIEEMITNLKVVKANRHEEENMQRFNEINDSLGKASLKAVFFSSLTNPSTRFVNSLVYAVVALTGAIIAVKGLFGLTITVGVLSCFLSYANQYTKPFNEISSVLTELQNAVACASRVFELIDTNSEVSDKNNHVLTNPKGKINLENVSFSYEENQRLIENLSLYVKPGDSIAIVGPTGCGKTTLINLLMRFYDVKSGKITIDDYNVKDITRHSLRDNIGMVLQDTWVKKASVIDNITLSRKDVTYEEVVNACKLSHADSFIRRLPNGYDTIIDDEGNLSVGQKQLLSIARVMLSTPRVLILDEATSSIDTMTEKKIQNAFDVLMKGKTSFVVAHRLSTIQNADVILVMKNGNVVEKGTHRELLMKKGFYYEIYNAQFINS